MKLYEVPNGTRVKLKEISIGPPGAREVLAGEVVYFCKIDGMYSLCVDLTGQPVYVRAWTEVEESRHETESRAAPETST